MQTQIGSTTKSLVHPSRRLVALMVFTNLAVPPSSKKRLLGTARYRRMNQVAVKAVAAIVLEVDIARHTETNLHPEVPRKEGGDRGTVGITMYTHHPSIAVA